MQPLSLILEDRTLCELKLLEICCLTVGIQNEDEFKYFWASLTTEENKKTEVNIN